MRSRRTDRTQRVSATVGYEARLRQMADTLRGSLDAAEYKQVVLGLLFLKYIGGIAIWRFISMLTFSGKSQRAKQ